MTEHSADYGLEAALRRYSLRRGGAEPGVIRAVLFDMDGILYDSMPHHALAWYRMCRENDIPADPDEFFMYEGRTGASTINILYRRAFGRDATDDEITRLYRRKTELFSAMPPVAAMPGAAETLACCMERGVRRVLVTGSGQSSLLSRLDTDYPGAFIDGMRITAHDVIHGKPDPEPFLKGMERACCCPAECIAVDNAPLGVESASRSGAFTIGVRTGPVPAGALLSAGADIELSSMYECAEILARLL